MNTKNNRAIVLCKPDPSGNPRPRRAIELLKSMNFDVDVASAPIKGSLEINNHFVIPKDYFRQAFLKRNWRRALVWCSYFVGVLLPINRIKFFLHHYGFGFGDLTHVFKKNYDLILVEDLYLLPSAIEFKGNSKVIFDAREYFLKQHRETRRFKLVRKPIIKWICKEYLHLCDSVITVSKGLAKEYNLNYGINPQVIRSTPNYSGQKPSAVNENNIKLVHHGNASSLRKLESMIDIVNLLDDRFTLDFYLNDNALDRVLYIQKLKEYAKNNKRIRFKKAVSFDDIIDTINKCDIGIFYVLPTTFNLKHTLPNKLFEFIQGRLMIAIGPSPDMAEVVNSYNCGIVTDNFNIQEMADALNRLTSEDIRNAKINSDLAAKELCFEQEGRILVNVINKLLN